MQFILAALAVAGLIFCTVMVRLLVPVTVFAQLPPFVGDALFPVASWGGMLGLSIFALHMRRKNKITLDLCATLIQALGIFSLLIGMGIAMAGFTKGDVQFVDGTFSEFAPLVTPLIEALVSVGFGMLVSATLLSIEEIRYGAGSVGTSGGVGGVAGGVGGFPPGFNPAAVAAEVRQLTEALKLANAEATKLGPTLKGFTDLLTQVGMLLTETSRFFIKAD